MEVADFIRTRQLYRKPVAVAARDEILAAIDTFRSAYGLHGELEFRVLEGGIVNAPICVIKRDGTEEKIIAVLKREFQSYEFASLRFQLLEKMTSMGFVGNPQIVKNQLGNHLTLIGRGFYSLMEYIAPDSSPA